MAHASVRKDFHFAQTDARLVNNLGKGRLRKTLESAFNFLDRASNIVDSESVVVAGTSWHLSVRTSVKGGQTYMQCFLCGAGNGIWHRWVDAEFVLRDEQGREIKRSGYTKKLVGSTPLFGSWGYPEWVTREVVLGIDSLRSLYDIVNNSSVTITVDFSVGIDVFSEEYSPSDVTLIVQGRALFANKGYLAVMSPVFAKMFFSAFKEANTDKVTLKDTKFEDFLSFLSLIYPLRETLNDANVLAACQLFHFYQVDFMLEEAETFLHLSTCCVPLVEKLLLAQELDRGVLFDRLVASMSVQDVKTIVKHDKKNQLSTESMIKILEKYIELKP